MVQTKESLIFLYSEISLLISQSWFVSIYEERRFFVLSWATTTTTTELKTQTLWFCPLMHNQWVTKISMITYSITLFILKNVLHITTTSKAFCGFKIHLRPYSIKNTRLCLQHLFLLTKITSLAEWTFAPYFNSNWITCSRFFLQATWRGVNPFWRENSTQWPSKLLVYCFVFGKEFHPFSP